MTTSRYKEIRERLLNNDPIKVIALDLDLPASSIHRVIPKLDIRRVWVTDGEWEALKQVRGIVGPLK